MIDFIAHAIANGGDWQKDYTEEQRDVWRKKARLGLIALWNPDPKICLAANEIMIERHPDNFFVTAYEAQDIWNAMLKKILEE